MSYAQVGVIPVVLLMFGVFATTGDVKFMFLTAQFFFLGLQIGACIWDRG